MLPVGFDESVLRVTEGLNREGSGIITEIDVKATLILGACHSALAYEALQLEDKVLLAPEGPSGMILRPTFPRPEHWKKRTPPPLQRVQ